MQRWEQIRGNPAVSALYTADASDPQCLPYDVRDALGDLLLDTDFTQLVKPAEQKAFNESVVALVNRQPLAQELWAHWMKLPISHDGNGKAKKHTHRTLFETLQQTADRELELISQLMETEEPQAPEPMEEEEAPQPAPATSSVTVKTEKLDKVEDVALLLSIVHSPPPAQPAIVEFVSAALEPKKKAPPAMARRVTFEADQPTDARVRAILAAARQSPPRNRGSADDDCQLIGSSTTAAALKLIEQFSKH